MQTDVPKEEKLFDQYESNIRHFLNISSNMVAQNLAGTQFVRDRYCLFVEKDIDGHTLSMTLPISCVQFLYIEEEEE